MKHSTLDTRHPASFERVIALKVDVDTFWGMREGVPRLLGIFQKHGVRASFFVPMGKDHTGWTVKRVFTRRGFLSKANRSGALKTYGLKTLLYGLLLPGPEIAKHHAELLKEVIDRGHELGIHGLDHVFWHDHIKTLGQKRTERILHEAVGVYKQILGVKPLSFAAPGWMINGHALHFFQTGGFRYSSDTRGRGPFFPVMNGVRFLLPQIPTTLPTLDEVVGLEGNDDRSLCSYFLNSLDEGFNVLTVHAELEGRKWANCLDMFLARALSAGFTFSRMVDVCDVMGAMADIPAHEIQFGLVNGRAGEVSLQGPELGVGRKE